MAKLIRDDTGDSVYLLGMEQSPDDVLTLAFPADPDLPHMVPAGIFSPSPVGYTVDMEESQIKFTGHMAPENAQFNFPIDGGLVEVRYVMNVVSLNG